jgi:hypothetical protein
VALAFRPFAAQPLQPREPPPLEALLERAVALRPFALDPTPPLSLRPASLLPLALETLRERRAAAPEWDHLGIAASETPVRHRSAARSWLSDAIVPSEPHAAGV